MCPEDLYCEVVAENLEALDSLFIGAIKPGLYRRSYLAYPAARLTGEGAPLLTGLHFQIPSISWHYNSILDLLYVSRFSVKNYDKQ